LLAGIASFCYTKKKEKRAMACKKKGLEDH
jgi:hypothetical protein